MNIKLSIVLLLLCIPLISCNITKETVSEGDEETVKLIFKYIEDDDHSSVHIWLKEHNNIDVINGQGETPLLKATRLNRIEIVKILLKAGADVNKQDYIKDSPFLYACATGRVEILNEMLHYNPDVTIYNRYGGNGLIPAAEKGHLETVAILLEKTSMDVNHINNLGWTALLEAIILSDGGKVHQEIIKILLQYGADVNIVDFNSVKPLTHARKKGYREIENILLAAGAKE